MHTINMRQKNYISVVWDSLLEISLLKRTLTVAADYVIGEAGEGKGST